VVPALLALPAVPVLLAVPVLEDAFAPQPALTVRVTWSMVQPSLDTISLHARSTAPPVSLLFSRFLI